MFPGLHHWVAGLRILTSGFSHPVLLMLMLLLQLLLLLMLRLLALLGLLLLVHTLQQHRASNEHQACNTTGDRRNTQLSDGNGRLCHIDTCCRYSLGTDVC